MSILRRRKNALGWDYPAGAENDPRAPWNEKGHCGCCPAHEDSAKHEDEADCANCDANKPEECYCAVYADWWLRWLPETVKDFLLSHFPNSFSWRFVAEAPECKCDECECGLPNED